MVIHPHEEQIIGWVKCHRHYDAAIDGPMIITAAENKRKLELYTKEKYDECV